MRNNGIIRKSVGSLLEDEAGIGGIEVGLILVVLCTINLRWGLCVLWVFFTF